VQVGEGAAPVASAQHILLRRQAELLVEKLAWLRDPDRIPGRALSGGRDLRSDPSVGCYQLARWMVSDIVAAAHGASEELPWTETFAKHRVPSDAHAAVRRVVLEPVTRYAPGILALAEIVASVPVVAVRGGATRSDWPHIAARSRCLGEQLSRDSTDVQLIVRRYLRRPSEAVPSTIAMLDAGLLRLDESGGVTSVTPMDELVLAAREAVWAHIGPHAGICLARLIRSGRDDRAVRGETMFDAVWAAFVHASDRHLFPPIVAARLEVPDQRPRDRGAQRALDRLAQERAAELRLRAASTQRLAPGGQQPIHASSASLGR
jgi:hypothetical protein